MFDRISNSWRLVKASWAVLQADKELMLFPLISFLASIVVIITFAVPFIGAGLFDALLGEDGPGILSMIIGFLFYLVMYTVVIFTNTALVGAALIRLEGGDPTFRDGWNIAVARVGSILGYALISATVGVILRAISERSGLLGQIVASVIGFVWGLATFLVIPVLVVEDIGPMEAVKRSAGLLRQTWGEQIVGNFGIGAVFGLLALVLVFLIFMPLLVLGISLNAGALIALAFGVLILGMIGLGLLSSALSGIYQAAVYRYTVDGHAGEFFDADLIQGAFKPKRG